MQPKLYLFVGYPGAGKTTVAQLLTEKTGAVHLWADQERRSMFGDPTHKHDESRQLYKHLNEQTSQLLASGMSVIFDTNFNFRADRDYLRQLATAQNADTVLIWMSTPVDLSRRRAVNTSTPRNGYDSAMAAEQFDSIVCKLEEPTEDEKPIKIDGTKLDWPDALRKLGL